MSQSYLTIIPEVFDNYPEVSNFILLLPGLGAGGSIKGVIAIATAIIIINRDGRS